MIHYTSDYITYHNAVGEVGGHDEIVLHHERRLLGVHDEPLDDLRAGNALLTVETRNMIFVWGEREERKTKSEVE